MLHLVILEGVNQVLDQGYYSKLTYQWEKSCIYLRSELLHLGQVWYLPSFFQSLLVKRGNKGVEMDKAVQQQASLVLATLRSVMRCACKSSLWTEDTQPWKQTTRQFWQLHPVSLAIEQLARKFNLNAHWIFSLSYRSLSGCDFFVYNLASQECQLFSADGQYSDVSSMDDISYISGWSGCTRRPPSKKQCSKVYDNIINNNNKKLCLFQLGYQVQSQLQVL